MTTDTKLRAWPLAIMDGDRPMWHRAGSNPPEYCEEPTLEALWRQRNTTMQLFAYHTRYTLKEIERIVGRRATVDRDGMTGIPGLVSVTSDDGDQYDFYGADMSNLVLLWVNDERRP
jgi:hypothetical protein